MVIPDQVGLHQLLNVLSKIISTFQFLKKMVLFPFPFFLSLSKLTHSLASKQATYEPR